MAAPHMKPNGFEVATSNWRLAPKLLRARDGDREVNLFHDHRRQLRHTECQTGWHPPAQGWLEVERAEHRGAWQHSIRAAVRQRRALVRINGETANSATS